MATKRVKASLVGMRFYGVTSAEVAQAIGREAKAEREPQNPHDCNAIAIVSRGRKLGHVDRGNAANIAPILDKGAICRLTLDPTRPIANASVPIVITLALESLAARCPRVCTGKVTGIYEIRVDGERKSYFGQSVDVQERIKAHWNSLAAGWHDNPELQEYWRMHGPDGFDATLKQAAPVHLRDLELSRWLVRQEQHWIDQAGGMRAVINADWPEPVLSAAAKEQLERERDRALGELSALASEVERLKLLIENKEARIVALESTIAASKKWFGLFVSADVMAVATRAPGDAALLRQEIASCKVERDKVQHRLQAMKDHLFL